MLAVVTVQAKRGLPPGKLDQPPGFPPWTPKKQDFQPLQFCATWHHEMISSHLASPRLARVLEDHSHSQFSNSFLPFLASIAALSKTSQDPVSLSYHPSGFIDVISPKLTHLSSNIFDEALVASSALPCVKSHDLEIGVPALI